MLVSFVVGVAVYLAVMSGVRFTLPRLIIGFAAFVAVWIAVGVLIGGPRGGTFTERLAAFLDRQGRR
jgi:hypothetical protein